MIYEEVFRTPCRGKVITPDPTHFRRDHEGEVSARTINSGSGLLRSCRQAHNEGAAVLYGSNVFAFDDTRFGYLTSSRDLCNGCQGMWHLESCILDRCDYVFMHDWLVTIGNQNRLGIRHLELRFSSIDFTTTQKSDFPDKMYEDLTLKGGAFVKNALQLLASAHHLETIELFFQPPADPWDPLDCKSQEVNTFGIISLSLPEFYAHKNHWKDLKSMLSSVQGINRLYCADITISKHFSYEAHKWNKVVDDANASLWEVRRIMESGYTPRTDRVNPVLEAATYVDQVERSMRIWQEGQSVGVENQ